MCHITQQNDREELHVDICTFLYIPNQIPNIGLDARWRFMLNMDNINKILFQSIPTLLKPYPHVWNGRRVFTSEAYVCDMRITQTQTSSNFICAWICFMISE